ncbi:hypothetical protein GCM10010123_33580 [Pilimelia anulata]|uniref:Uncharacterized protein n=1 Tax=Pilimelia anulata TaxID=53371 RepID=A0A8J3BFX5_9ACTN|nr:hypothetical protein [Pilimelia anulata]GGK00911.1 hypothetical protein GCM10010123_33580 [Pilimelia anulata]
MPNGKPGDSPVTDVVVHHLAVFGWPCDDLIREIAELGGGAELAGLHLHGLDPRSGGKPDLAVLAERLRMVRDHLPR